MNKSYIYSKFSLSVNIRVVIFFLLGVFYVLYVTTELWVVDKFILNILMAPSGLEVYTVSEPTVHRYSYTGIIFFYHKYINSAGQVDLLWPFTRIHANAFLLP